MYVGMLVDRLRRVTEGLVEDEQGGFRSGRRYIEKIFTLRQIDEKTGEGI